MGASQSHTPLYPGPSLRLCFIHPLLSLIPSSAWFPLLLCCASFSSLCSALTSHLVSPPLVISSTSGFSPKFQRFTLPWAPDPVTSVSDLRFNMSPSPHLLFHFRLYFSKFLHHLLICETSLAPLVCLTSNQPQTSVGQLCLLKSSWSMVGEGGKGTYVILPTIKDY